MNLIPKVRIYPKSRLFLWLADTPKNAKCYYCGEPAIVTYTDQLDETINLCAECEEKKAEK